VAHEIGRGSEGQIAGGSFLRPRPDETGLQSLGSRGSRIRQSRQAFIVRWEEGADPVDFSDELAAEEPLEIRIGGKPVSVTMRTPGHDLELVAGMLLTENLIEPDAVPLLRHEHPNIVNAAISAGGERMRRSSIMSTSCGLCGKASIEAVHQHFPPVHDDFTIPRVLLSRLLEGLEVAQPAFTRTGGLHAAAVFDSAGTPIVAREDIGRHNAVDKVIGNALLRGLLPLSGHILLVSGRASFEIVQKALGARIPIVAAVSAPSSLAVEFACASGQTLIGFLRRGRCNLYTHVERVTA
jgi:FdhD protein